MVATETLPTLKQTRMVAEMLWEARARLVAARRMIDGAISLIPANDYAKGLMLKEIERIDALLEMFPADAE